MIRKLCLCALGLLLAVGGYAAWPLISAYQIKTAIKTGDTALLERRVLWEPVRASLKQSLASLPPAANIDDEGHTRHGLPRRSLWSRIKAAAAPILLEKMIDTYVTADGLTRLQEARRRGLPGLAGLLPGASAIADRGHSEIDRTAGAGNELQRIVAFYQRIIRARFHSLSAVEFEIADKGNPDRRYISQFELQDFEWKLASVRVVGAGF